MEREAEPTIHDLVPASQAWDQALKDNESRARKRALLEAMTLCVENPRATAHELWRKLRLRREGQG